MSDSDSYAEHSSEYEVDMGDCCYCYEKVGPDPDGIDKCSECSKIMCQSCFGNNTIELVVEHSVCRECLKCYYLSDIVEDCESTIRSAAKVESFTERQKNEVVSLLKLNLEALNRLEKHLKEDKKLNDFKERVCDGETIMIDYMAKTKSGKFGRKNTPRKKPYERETKNSVNV